VELYAILDHAEARFGDDRLENVIAPPNLSNQPPPTHPNSIPPSESSSPQILSIVAEELPAEEIPAEEDAAAE
jgi:hypothetical protein